MKILFILLVMNSALYAQITSSANGAVIKNITASARGGGLPFDGTVNEKSDLEDLVATAWGLSRWGLHRGHSPIRNALEAFLGITHSQMHVLMERDGLNLAAVSRKFGFEPENLIETLTLSFMPYIEQGVRQGLIQDADLWKERVRSAFRRRVYWTGK